MKDAIVKKPNLKNYVSIENDIAELDEALREKDEERAEEILARITRKRVTRGLIAGVAIVGTGIAVVQIVKKNLSKDSDENETDE